MSTSRRKFLGMASAGAASTLFPDLIRQALAVPAYSATGTLADVQHVVIFMQENRSFDHYFGTLAGVRGFNDPRAITLPGGKAVWYQPNGTGGYVLPFHFDAKNTSALSLGTNHSWKGSQTTWQGWDAWVKQKTAQSMGYFDRGDLPFYYALADAFTICDDYHCSIFGATDPNRMYSLTGSNQNWLGAMGSLYNIDSAGYYNNDPKYDNITPSVTASAPNWRTYAEVLEANSVSWKVYQEWDNYGDNYLAYFRNFRVNADGTRLSESSPLYQKGRVIAPGSYESNARGTKGDWLVNSFADDVRNNRLPQVSWIVAPNDYTEHSPNSPNAGENLTARLLAALVANPDVWSKTVFLLTYDENDGFFDHIPSHMAPLNTGMGRSTLADNGQYENYNGIPVGLGPRVPMLVISPWSKGGRVCSQLFDHTSKLRFLEEWLVAGLGKQRSSIACENISPWRRAVCGDLTSAFDFKTPNSSWPSTVPKSTTYQLVSGKPYPQPPAVQTLPMQEGGSPRYSCALPYAFAATARVNLSKQVELSFFNQGLAGGAFIVYSHVRSDGPWYYTVEAGKKIEREAWNWSTPNYHLSVVGPGGFQREFAGVLALATATGGARPEAWLNANPLAMSVDIVLSNVEGLRAATFRIVDNAYGRAATSHTVAAGQQAVVSIPVGASYGWYDLAVTCDFDAQYLRRMAGRVENGQASRTDPVLGRTPAGPRATLSASAASVPRGTPISFSYSVPAPQVNSKNWIGIYRNGVTPGSTASLSWQYVTSGAGTAAFATSGLAAGSYAAWLLYNDGYSALAGPVAFTVT
ncbi:phosphocholine-specific phospholipase C [Pseudoduganella sp. R-34]|uniref:phosphocholine-specific phospholipase C n=1 Tax=Pseudoduganella sp. R-34 TaxID=3404062 RepID=UPI003CF771BE